MIYKEKEFFLKDNQKVIIKTPPVKDAKALLYFINNAAEDSKFLLTSPEDMKRTVEEEKEYLKKHADSKDLFLCAYVDGKIVGDASLYFDRHVKFRHRGDLGLAVDKEYWGLGIGSLFFEILIEAANTIEGIEQLNLECLASNERGLNLYKKFGFIETGRRPKYLKQIDGSYDDEIVMTKFLENR